jgi:hypothetical protein
MRPPQKVTRQDIEAALERVGGVVEKAADALGFTVQALCERALAVGLQLGLYRTQNHTFSSDGVETRTTVSAGLSLTTRAEVRVWSECRGELDRQQVLADALRMTKGNRTHAAKLLKMNRGHLQDLLAKYARMAHEGVGSTDRPTPPDTDGGVGPTVLPALTYWLPAPSFHHVSSALAVTTDEAKIQIVLPKPLKDWLERKALDQKQSNGGRFAVSPVIVDILEAQRLREERGE